MKELVAKFSRPLDKNLESLMARLKGTNLHTLQTQLPTAVRVLPFLPLLAPLRWELSLRLNLLRVVEKTICLGELLEELTCSGNRQ